MNLSKRLAGPCSHCGRSIDYPAHLVGTTAKCPFCGEATELRLATPPEEPSISKRVIVFTIVATLMLIIALAACFAALKWAESLRQRKQPPPPAAVQQ